MHHSILCFFFSLSRSLSFCFEKVCLCLWHGHNVIFLLHSFFYFTGFGIFFGEFHSYHNHFATSFFACHCSVILFHFKKFFHCFLKMQKCQNISFWNTILKWIIHANAHNSVTEKKVNKMCFRFGFEYFHHFYWKIHHNFTESNKQQQKCNQICVCACEWVSECCVADVILWIATWYHSHCHCRRTIRKRVETSAQNDR